MTNIQIDAEGAQTILNELQVKFGLKLGDTVTVVDLESALVLSPKSSRVSEIAARIEKVREDVGLSVEASMEGLVEQRRRYTKEKYGTGDE
jgi:hypothetical protein